MMGGNREQSSYKTSEPAFRSADGSLRLYRCWVRRISVFWSLSARVYQYAVAFLVVGFALGRSPGRERTRVVDLGDQRMPVCA